MVSVGGSGCAWWHLALRDGLDARRVTSVRVGVEPAPDDPFKEFVTELADGQRWALIRSRGWDDFVERLTRLVGELEPRRRQALMMLLFLLMDEQLTPDDAKSYIAEHDTESDGGIETMIAWLRQFRPPAQS
jgi:hypothetical protein